MGLLCLFSSWTFRGTRWLRSKRSTDGCSRSSWTESLSKCRRRQKQNETLKLSNLKAWMNTWSNFWPWSQLFGDTYCIFLYLQKNKQKSSTNNFFLFFSDRMKDHKINPVTLCFVDNKLEEHYSSEKEKRSGAAFFCCIIVLFFITAMEVFIDPLWVNASSWLDEIGFLPSMILDLFKQNCCLLVLLQTCCELCDSCHWRGVATNPHTVLPGRHLPQGKFWLNSLLFLWSVCFYNMLINIKKF